MPTEACKPRPQNASNLSSGAPSPAPENDAARPVSQPTNPQPDHLSGTDSPKRRKQSTNSVSPSLKALARETDPNRGLCLLTKCSEGVEVCRLVTTANDALVWLQLTKLERAWGTGNIEIQLDTCYNLIFLRADWHIIFDEGNLMLIPQYEDLKTLQLVTRPEDNAPNVNAAWLGRTTFQYHLLPVEEFKKPIRRFQGPESNSERDIHRAPYTKLGVLTSHVRPHFVVVNTAQKLIARTTHSTNLVDFGRHLRKITRNSDALQSIVLIVSLYDDWINPSEVDDGSSGDKTGNLHEPSPGGAHQDDVDSAPSDSDDENTINDADNATSDDATGVEGICGWVKQCFEDASEGGWERELVNDGQVVDYAKEDSLPVPPPESWDTFHPSFKRAKVPGKIFDTEQFTSNDWSVFMECSPLFGTGR